MMICFWLEIDFFHLFFMPPTSFSLNTHDPSQISSLSTPVTFTFPPSLTCHRSTSVSPLWLSLHGSTYSRHPAPLPPPSDPYSDSTQTLRSGFGLFDYKGVWENVLMGSLKINSILFIWRNCVVFWDHLELFNFFLLFIIFVFLFDN